MSEKKEEIVLNDYTKQKMAHLKLVEDMKAAGWVIQTEYRPFHKGFAPFRVWVRLNPVTGEYEQRPFFGFI